ncbi:GspH/FimT family protein [Larsenimonas rhizosphaerae]|uniref:Type II secretion system protein H n=1 Tax=Larsenimonas rhizosphaerae TaxID=2944682 RepID=A0AA41ZHR9_9GAMM|nr:GspH/FimT family pseudopilin [Larsenimonas rhizosphaerae]MCX2525467.1 GspH/FimT family pseudopilin [Larsenimonas rhizosphaerae]
MSLHCRPINAHTQKGMSLISSIISLVCLGLLLSAGLSSISSGHHQRLLLTESQSLKQLITTAKQYSYSEQHPVTLCGSRDGTVCLKQGIWQWALVIDTHTRTIITRHAVADSLAVSWKGFRSRLDFNPTPWRQALNGRLTICHPDAPEAQAYQLIINAMGRVRTQQSSRECTTS